jgi:cleavage and polyadenylation specificity factor subunit 2
MARIAVVDHVEALRAEENVDSGVTSKETYTGIPEQDGGDEAKSNSKSSKCIATMKQVHDAFDSFTTLRYSQPTHLQGQLT